jgi:hypothetical protein
MAQLAEANKKKHSTNATISSSSDTNDSNQQGERRQRAPTDAPTKVAAAPSSKITSLSPLRASSSTERKNPNNMHNMNDVAMASTTIDIGANPTIPPSSLSSMKMKNESTPTSATTSIGSSSSTDSKAPIISQNGHISSLPSPTEKVTSISSTMDTSDDNSDDDDNTKDEFGDIACDICMEKGTLEEDNDEIYRCIKCRVATHQSCYGGDLIDGEPDRDKWTCESCLIDEDARCFLCPSTNHKDHKNHMLKPTGDGRWVHIVCILFHQYVQFSDAKRVANLTGLDKLDPGFFKLTCKVFVTLTINIIPLCDMTDLCRFFVLWYPL